MCFELNGRKDTKNAITCTHENRLSNSCKKSNNGPSFFVFLRTFFVKTLNNK